MEVEEERIATTVVQIHCQEMRETECHFKGTQQTDFKDKLACLKLCTVHVGAAQPQTRTLALPVPGAHGSPQEHAGRDTPRGHRPCGLAPLLCPPVSGVGTSLHPLSVHVQWRQAQRPFPFALPRSLAVPAAVRRRCGAAPCGWWVAYAVEGAPALRAVLWRHGVEPGAGRRGNGPPARPRHALRGGTGRSTVTSHAEALARAEDPEQDDPLHSAPAPPKHGPVAPPAPTPAPRRASRGAPSV